MRNFLLFLFYKSRIKLSIFFDFIQEDVVDEDNMKPKLNNPITDASKDIKRSLNEIKKITNKIKTIF